MKTSTFVSCIMLLLALIGCGKNESTKTGTGSGKLGDSVLSCLRHPRAGQFPEPEAAVRFLLEQVRNQDLDEATRVFAVAEIFERQTFSDVRFHRYYSPLISPSPIPTFSNLRRALVDLEIFDRLTFALLLGDDYGKSRFFPEKEGEKPIEEYQARFDVGRLKGLRIAQIGRAKDEMKTPSKALSETDKRMGITEITLVTTVVECGDHRAKWEFLVGKIDDNWRVLNLAEIKDEK